MPVTSGVVLVQYAIAFVLEIWLSGVEVVVVVVVVEVELFSVGLEDSRRAFLDAFGFSSSRALGDDRRRGIGLDIGMFCGYRVVDSGGFFIELNAKDVNALDFM